MRKKKYLPPRIKGIKVVITHFMNGSPTGEGRNYVWGDEE